MQIDCRRLDTCMTEQFLNLQETRAIFKQMCGEGMPKDMNGHMFGDIRTYYRFVKGMHDAGGSDVYHSVSTEEEPSFRILRTVELPIFTQYMEASL